MNTKLQEFFENRGHPYYAVDIIHNWTDQQWEKSHDFIQWLFPTTTKSKYNQDAPLLDAKTARWIKDNYDSAIHLAVLRFIKFLKDTDALNKQNHNFLRITRVIQSLREMGFYMYAQLFFNYVMSWTTVNGTHFEYWTNAMTINSLTKV